MFPSEDPFKGHAMVCERDQPEYVPLVLENDTEGISEFVDNAFSLILEDLGEGRTMIDNQLAYELKDKNVGEIKHIFNEQFLISNHMVKCYIIPVIRDPDKPIKLPLIDLRKYIPHSFISPWAFPSLLIFNKNNPCSANLAPTGIMNVTGGYNLQQLKDAIKFFCSIVIKALKKLTKEKYQLEDIHFKLRVASNKVGGKTFNLIALNDYCIKNDITAVYDPGSINRLQLFPFPKTWPSIGANIFPSGGITLYGFTKLSHAEKCVVYLKSLLWRFISVDTNFVGFDRYFARRQREENNRLNESFKRKEKKIAKWESKIRPKEERHIYEAWKSTEDNHDARTYLRSIIAKEEVEIKALKKKYKKDPVNLAERIKEIEDGRMDYEDLLNHYLEDSLTLVKQKKVSKKRKRISESTDKTKKQKLTDEILTEPKPLTIRERLENE